MKNNKFEKFDYENFDYDKCYEEVKNNIKKPVILICGGTGVGKSSLINDIFDIDIAPVGDEGKPQTQKNEEYSCEDSTVTLIDTKGYEIGVSDKTKNDEFFRTVIGEIDNRKKNFPGRMEKHVHEVWYCIHDRFLPIDEKIIKEVIKKEVPVIVIITKVDSLDEESVNQIKKDVYDRVSGIEVYTYATVDHLPSDNENYKKYVQKTEIINWALKNLDQQLQSGLIPALKGGIKEKRNLVITSRVPYYVCAAAATVMATSFIPVPFSDSIPLMGIQIKMAMDIIKTYGIENNISRTIQDVIGANLVSYIGKTLATQILSVIPGFGSIAKATVNVSVAATITAVLGISISIICEQYLKLCIDNGGAENLPDFSDFITKERLAEVMKTVNSEKEKYGISDMISNAIASIKNKVSKK